MMIAAYILAGLQTGLMVLYGLTVWRPMLHRKRKP